MFALVRRAYPYRNLTRETFDAILEMLSEESRRGAGAMARICIAIA